MSVNAVVGPEVVTSKGPVQPVEITKLKLGLSPRHGGADEDHARMLSGNLTQLPPILVYPDENLVIDGAHRLLAAVQRGLKEVPVQVFEGTYEEALAEAILSNVRPGKPLSMTERCDAVRRLC